MANLNETDDWTAGIYQLEEDDPVLGGPAGIDNLAPRQLANRALYQRLRNITPWAANFTYPADVAFVSHAGRTWKSVASSIAVQPGTDETKWTRWAHTEAELNSVVDDVIAEHEQEVDPHNQYALWASLAEVIADAGFVANRGDGTQLLKAFRKLAVGRRNVLINAAGSINVRGYVSGTATSGPNKYAIDRWYVNTAGQALSWIMNGGVAIFNAPPGGMTQAIRAQNIQGGTYVLSWVGTATATVNGEPVANGGTIVLPANTIARVTFSGGTMSLPQLEMGSEPSRFDWQNYELETAICSRYFNAVGATWNIAGYASAGGQILPDAFITYPPMYGIPAASVIVGGGVNVTAGALSVAASALTQTATATTPGYARYTFTLNYLDADFI